MTAKKGTKKKARKPDHLEKYLLLDLNTECFEIGNLGTIQSSIVDILCSHSLDAEEQKEYQEEYIKVFRLDDVWRFSQPIELVFSTAVRIGIPHEK